ncbi:hypothetical protein ATZ36_05240 [Candidatus Endomicrobiellum trichonymphae]|uniref:Lipoprotein n=1 Tax=Endomicrobium trichonymphae TaxID=1408204 RepID=A0A1E5IIF3_ENDTX|nr:hypothetical protein ATZ36_05240 [Candidatus Endomicrobium trichonymphae]
MKNTISIYVISAFLLTSFAGCGKLKNIVGLNQSIKDLTEEQILERVQREAEKVLERELKSFNFKDMVRPKFSADGLRAVVDYRYSLVKRLIKAKGAYYEYILESKKPAPTATTDPQSLKDVKNKNEK